MGAFCPSLCSNRVQIHGLSQLKSEQCRGSLGGIMWGLSKILLDQIQAELPILIEDIEGENKRLP